KVGMRSRTEGSAIRLRMKMRDVAADRKMRRERNPRLVSRTKKGNIFMLRFQIEHGAAHCLAKTNLIARTVASRSVKQLSRFFGAAKHAFAQCRIDIFRSRSHHRDLGIVNQDRSISRNPAHKTSLHQIDDDRRQTCLDYVPANPPNDRLAKRARAPHTRSDLSNALHCEDVRKRLKIIAKRCTFGNWFREITNRYLAGSRGQRISADFIETDRLEIVDRHSLRGRGHPCPQAHGLLFRCRKLLKIGKILQPAGCMLVDPEMFQANKTDGFFVERRFKSLAITFFKTNSGR